MPHDSLNVDAYDYAKPWYHGSPFELTVLRVGSSVTQYPDVARAFSHKPALLSLNVSISDGEGVLRVAVKHNGSLPGFLYRVVDDLGPDDIHPHEACNPEILEEWLTDREVQVELICVTAPRPDELLSEEEASQLLERTQSGE